MKLFVILSFAASSLAFSPSVQLPQVSTRATVHSPVALGASTVPSMNQNVFEEVSGEVIEPSYYLTWSFALMGAGIIAFHPSYAAQGPSLIGIAGGAFHLLFAALLWVQTRRVRAVFDDEGFEFYNIKGHELDLQNGAYLEEKPGNWQSGTRNRWTYDTIINYGFFPSVDYPLLCYFKETETPKEDWNKGISALDSKNNGHPHFFPGIISGYQFKAQMDKHGVPHKV